jgi:pyruvate formate lyase activating enzyme
VTTVQAREAVASVHSWDLSTGVDGPGTRLVVFLSGCPLRCLYCHNPDTWRRAAGTPTPFADLRALVDRYAPFVGRAGGGLTVSGGEPLMQPEAVRALFAHARERGVHTALDTSGFLGVRADDALLDLTDLVLLDVKAGTERTCVRLTRRPLAPTLAFARRLADRGVPVWIRHVLVPGVTDVPEELEAVADVAAGLGNVERVDVLPFHTLGCEKYDRLGIPFPLEGVRPPTAEAVAAARARFAARGLRAC